MIEFDEVIVNNSDGNEMPETRAGIVCGVYDCSGGAICGINCDVVEGN